MTHLEQYRNVEALETFLGDPADPTMPISFAGAVAEDERDAFPEAGYAALEQWGMAQHYVPLAQGGRLGSFAELLALWRAMARRDLTLAIAHAKTFLGAIPVWVAGSPEQQARLAAIIRRGGQVALALSERAHGSDLLASEVMATPCENGYTLHGEKWLINNATRGAAMSLLARTNPAGGARGTSLFLVEKAALDPHSYSHAAKVKTQGIRGADISGIRFDGSYLPSEALLGAAGGGLELTLKILQLTRTMCAGLSLGAADTALRVTLDFALGRRLYGDTVFAIPHARATLVNAFLDLLICDCVAIAAARAIHAVPGQMSVWSAVAKYFVPTTLERTIRELGVVLGGRHYLREEHQFGAFQKLVRDSAIVSLFDGSTVVNLQVIAQQLRPMADRRARGADEDLAERLAAIFELERPVAEFRPAGLELHNRGQDDVLQGLGLAAAHIHSLASEGGADEVAVAAIGELLQLLHEEIAALDQERAEGERAHGHAFSRSPELFELARRHCALHAAAACAQMWRHNREHLGAFFGQGEWLALCLSRLLQPPLHERVEIPFAFAERAAEELARLHRDGRLFSIVPLRLNGAHQADDEYREIDHADALFKHERTANLAGAVPN